MSASEHDEDSPTDTPADWAQRRLCPDGGCLGVLGRDGLCAVCGRGDDSGPDRARLDHDAANEALADGDDADPDDADRDDADPDDTDADDDDPDDEDAPADSLADGDPADDNAAADWQQRQLCIDGACIGIVEQGRCNTCGMSI
jgi:hypothetical protein